MNRSNPRTSLQWIAVSFILISSTLACGTVQFGLAPTASVEQIVQATIEALSTENAGLAEDLENQLATPMSDSPAAGICPEAEGETARFSIQPGIPDPRCQVVRADQSFRIVNRTDQTLGVRLGRYSGEIGPGEDFTIEQGFGEYLLPGVHGVEVDPCCGPTLWFKP
jgi:hypothetical protein